MLYPSKNYSFLPINSGAIHIRSKSDLQSATPNNIDPYGSNIAEQSFK